MTIRKGGPYHFQPESLPIRRLDAIAPLAALTLFGGCATSSHDAVQKELSSLRAELRAIREQNDALERRMARVEDAQVVARAKAKPEAPLEQPVTPHEVPSLTVVKLKPKTTAAPKLPIASEVVEPDEDSLSEMLVAEPTSEGEEKEPRPDVLLADAAYEDGLKALKTGNIAGAVLKLQTFVVENPRHARADNALYFSGVGLLSLDDVEGAAEAFERVLAAYPAGDARMEAMLRLADCRLKLNQLAQARDLYARLINTFPGTTAAQEARERLGKITQ